MDGFQPGWGTVAQAIVMAVCTWYMRRGSVKDKREVLDSTISHQDALQIRADLASLRVDFEGFRFDYYKQNEMKKG